MKGSSLFSQKAKRGATLILKYENLVLLTAAQKFLTGRAAHLSFFERWDSTSLSRLGFMDSADASQFLYFSGNQRKMRRKPGAA